jgi:hypothetical protein
MNNQDEQEPTFPTTFPEDAMNESDLGELVNFNSNNNNSNSMNDPTLKNKKKKAKAASPVARKKSFAKHDETLKEKPKRALSAYNIVSLFGAVKT